MRYLLRSAVLLISIAFLSSANAAWAVNIPSPMSGGKFIESKGTKASEDFQGRAGGPGYDYESRMQLGSIFLKPYIEYHSVWDDNIFLEPSGEEEDFISNIYAGVGADWPIDGGRHLVAASYGIRTELFHDEQSQDHTDHIIQVGAELNFVPFSLTLQDTWTQTVGRADTEFTSRVKRDQNALDVLLEVPFAQFFLETEIVDFDLDFRKADDSAFDRHLITVFQRAGIDITPSTQFLGEYSFTDIHYKNVDDREGDANAVSLGLRGNWTEKITYQVWGGFESRIYETDIRPDFNDFIWRGALRYNISETGLLTLKGDRKAQESTFDGQSFYTRNRFELGWRQQIAERWFFRTREVYSFNDYSRVTVLSGQEEVREDDIWLAGAGVEYRMPNDLVSFLLEYNYKSRNSNFSTLDYDNQTVTLGVKARY